MRPVARFAQFENRTTGHHFTAVAYKRGDDVLQVHDLRLTMVQSYHVDAEGDLQLGLGIEVVKHHFPTASRFTSITMRIPSLSDSSRSALMPSTRFL